MGLVSKAHKIALTRPGNDGGAQPEPREAKTTGPESSSQGLGLALGRTNGKQPRLSQKSLALMVVCSILIASGGFAWMLYFRHWSMDEIEAQVIDDPTKDAPGFKHDLAGKSVTVEGRLTSVRQTNTTAGEVNQLYLDGGDRHIGLIVWGPVPYSLGDRVVMTVHFEWAYSNGERHVYSEQLDFPWFQMLSFGPVIEAVANAGGTLMIPTEIAEGSVRMTVFDQSPPLRMEDANCTFSAGEHSWWGDYWDALRLYGYGTRLDEISNLTQESSDNGRITFADADGDGNLSAGDWFDVTGIEKPDSAAGIRSYMLVVDRTNYTAADEYRHPAPCYLAILHSGLVRIIPETPYGRLSAPVVTNGTVETTLTKLSRPVSWDDVRIELTGVNTVNWEPTATGLKNGAPSVEDLGVRTSGTVQVGCVARDEAGNGFLDVGDSITFYAYGTSFTPTMNYTYAMLYEPTYEWFCQGTFRG